MGGVDGAADLGEQLEPGLDGQVLVVAVPVDRLALDEFHDEVGSAVGGRPGVEDARDVGVVDRPQDLAFELEPGEHVLGVEPEAHDLDRDAFLERVVGAHGGVDRAHAAAPDLAEDAVDAQGLGKGRGDRGARAGRWGSRGRPGGRGGAGVNRLVEGLALGALGAVVRVVLGRAAGVVWRFVVGHGVARGSGVSRVLCRAGGARVGVRWSPAGVPA